MALQNPGKSRPQPINVESEFGEDELFFSTTDIHGVINFGNDLFVRVSKYAESELIGSPHNIVRHPEMPKAVFKLFWNYLNDKKPVVAYVKNMAKDGSYYWVLAIAFPQSERFISIRIKPSSPFFGKAVSIYQQVLQTEKKEGIEGGMRVLSEQLQAEGFANYDTFMSKALLEELKVWKPLVQPRAKRAEREGKRLEQGALRKLDEFETHMSEVLEYNRRLFLVLTGFISLNSDLLQASESLMDLSVELNRKALNLAILCANGGEVCAPISAVAQSMTSTSRRCDESINQIVASIRTVLEKTELASFRITAPLLQGETIQAFIQEIRERISSGKTTPEDDRKAMLTLVFLLGILNNFSTGAIDLLASLGESVRALLQQLMDFGKNVRVVELIHGTGTIEAAHSGTSQSALLGVLEGILKSSRSSGGEIRRFIVSASEILRNCDQSFEDGGGLFRSISLMQELCGESVPNHEGDKSFALKDAA